MKNKKRLVLIGLAVVIVVVVIVNVRLSYEASTEVEVEVVGKGGIVEKVSGPGVVHAESSVKISSSVMGRVTRLAVKEGDPIEEGSVLLEIESSQYRARLNQAQAAHRAALARLEQARAESLDARAESDRKRRLAENDLVSNRDLEVAGTALAVARAGVEAAAAVAKEASASLQAALDDLEKTVITAPISGTVTSLNVEEGEIAITGTMNNPGTVLMTISDLGTMEVRAEIDETDVARVYSGQQVEVSVDAFPDTVLTGTVSVIGSSSSTAMSVAYRPDERSTFEVRIRIEDRLPGLRPGMTTTVDIVTATRDSVASVPLQALVLREIGEGDEKSEREGIFIVRDGRSRFTPVRTGISDDKDIEVLWDLPEDTRVVTGPFKALRDLADSTKVKITEERE
ncbi:MAG: efflux RND transporter periplasmic adaptor subunit [Candidatus Eisenbacteria bacterium]